MKQKYHYSVVGLQEDKPIKVLSMEQPTAVGNLLRSEQSPREYRVRWCADPMPTERDASFAAVNDKVTLRLELVKW